MLNRSGEMARVESLFEEARMLYRKAGNELGVASTLIESATGLYWFSEGDAATIQVIRQRLQEGQSIVSKLGARYWIAYCAWLGSLIALTEGDITQAESLAQESLALMREIGIPWFVAFALYVLGRVETQRNDLPAAVSWYQQSLSLTLELGDRYITPYNLLGLADVLAAQGEPTRAAELWGAAEALLEAGGFPVPALDRATYEQGVAAVRVQLGEPAFASAWATGRAMTPEHISVVLQEVSLSELVPAAKQQSQPTAPSDLTARELEVLRLLARGLSNAQIAEELVVSHLTVKAHLRSIYSKLGVTSRSAATRYALEHHLG